MKKYYLSFSLLTLLVVIASLFAPLVIVDKTGFSSLFVVFCLDFSGITAIFIVGYLLLIASIVLSNIPSIQEKMIGTNIFLNVLSFFVFTFSSELAKFVFDRDDVYIGAGAIMLMIVSVINVTYMSLLPKEKKAIDVRSLVEISMLVSLSVVLDTFVKIPIGATGGSINIAMLPLMIIALRNDFKISFIASGLIFGLVTCLIDGYGLMYLPFDYVLGFGSVAIISLFRHLIIKHDSNKITIIGVVCLIVSAALVFVLRTLSSSISSMVYYGYTFEASIIYNVTYIGPSVLACLILLIALYKPLLMVFNRYPAF